MTQLWSFPIVLWGRFQTALTGKLKNFRDHFREADFWGSVALSIIGHVEIAIIVGKVAHSFIARGA
jgi:hypothetical protein